MSELKKLETGKTEIGKVVAKDQDGMIRDFVIYYGNAASPLVDGNVMHLKENRYQEMLKAFLESEDGREYEAPSEEEIRQATIEMLNRETKAKQYQEEQERKRLEEEAKEKARLLEEERAKRTIEVEEGEFAPYDPVPDPLEEAMAEEKAVEMEVKELEARISEARKRAEEAGKARRELEKRRMQEEKRLRASEKPAGTHRLANILLTVALVIALAMSAVQYLAASGRLSLPTGYPKAQERAELDINGETYTVPLADLTLAEGEGKIVIYGITTYIQDGEVHHSAMPLGEYVLAEEQIGN